MGIWNNGNNPHWLGGEGTLKIEKTFVGCEVRKLFKIGVKSGIEFKECFLIFSQDTKAPPVAKIHMKSSF